MSLNQLIWRRFFVTDTEIGRPSFGQWANTLWQGGYTGCAKVHWLHGRVQMIEMDEGQLRIEAPAPPKRRRVSDPPAQLGIKQARAPWNSIG